MIDSENSMDAMDTSSNINTVDNNNGCATNNSNSSVIMTRSQISQYQLQHQQSSNHNNSTVQRNILHDINTTNINNQSNISNSKNDIVSSLPHKSTATHPQLYNVQLNDDMSNSIQQYNNNDQLTVKSSNHDINKLPICISCHGPLNKCRKQISKSYNDKSSFSGEICSKTGKRWSHGIFINRHSDKYDGEWVDDKRSGNGQYSWSSGDIYDGEWKNGTMEGHGAFRWANGDSYVGQWKSGRMDGHGIKTMANGDSYEGEWKNDKANGRGCKKFACGDKHEGEYKDDRRHGAGVYMWSSGDKYDGNWDNGKMSGHGTKTMANGDVYQGMWLADKAHGWGCKRFNGGDSHEGEYRCDARHGYGTYKWANGDKFQGEWVEGEQRGKGTYYYASLDVFKGTWVDGKKSGRGIFTSTSTCTSWLEAWENGIRTTRREIKYYPTRLLRTSKDSCDKKSEALRIRTEIDRLQNRLAIIQTQVSPHKPSSSNTDMNTPIQSNNTTPQLNSVHTTSGTVLPALHIPQTQLTISVPSSPINNRNAMSSADEDERRHVEMMLDTAVDIIYAAQSSPRRTTPTHRSLSNSPHTHTGHTEEQCCKVCMEQQINTVLIRCGHMCVCKLCATSLDRCPICRQQIEEVIQTFRV